MVPSTAVLKSRRQTNPPPTPSLGEEASTHRPNGADAVTPAAFNEGLMELGALVCTPAAPKCLVCPLRDFCLAREQGCVEEIPAPKARAKRSRVYHDTVVLWRKTARGVEVLLEQRPATGLWAGLWQPPTVERTTPKRRTLKSILATLGIDGGEPPDPKPRQMVFQTSHREVVFRFWVFQAKSERLRGERWFDAEALKSVGLSNAHRGLIESARVFRAS